MLEVLKSFAVPTLVSGGVAYAAIRFLGEKIITHRLGKDLERYKLELGEKTEVLKAQLSIYSHEQNVASSRVDSQRSRAIHNVYTSMRAIIKPIGSIVAGSPLMNADTEEHIEFYIANAEQAYKATVDMTNTLVDEAIYFDAETYEKIADFLQVAQIATATYLRPLRKHKAEEEDDLRGMLDIADRNRLPIF